MVEKYFPGEFGSERLVKSAVDSIIKGTTKKSSSDTVQVCHPTPYHPASKQHEDNSSEMQGMYMNIMNM